MFQQRAKNRTKANSYWTKSKHNFHCSYSFLVVQRGKIPLLCCLAIKPWACNTLPYEPTKTSTVLWGDLWGRKKAISGQTQRWGGAVHAGREQEGARGENDPKESGRKAEGSDTDRERRCLIWHGVPQRHLISFDPCGRWKQGSRSCEEMARPGGESTNLPQMSTENVVCVCLLLTDRLSPYLRLCPMAVTHTYLSILYNIIHLFYLQSRKSRGNSSKFDEIDSHT